MNAESPQHQELWRSRWVVANPRATDHGVWAVTYVGTPVASIPVADLDVAGAQQNLVEVLREAIAFFTEQALTNWVDWYSQALALASPSTALTASNHRDWLPKAGYGADARRLLAIANRAGAFGGAGSWNDIAWGNQTDQLRYVDLSGRLSRAINHGCVAAVNSPLAPLSFQ
jgi:hypothetical protein